MSMFVGLIGALEMYMMMMIMIFKVGLVTIKLKLILIVNFLKIRPNDLLIVNFT